MAQERCGAGRQPRAQRGVLAVELAAMIPLVVAFALVLLQGFFVFSTIGSVEKASRDGARAAMRGGSVEAAVERSLPDWLTVQSISTGNGAAACPGRCVTVEARVPLGLPVFTTSELTVTRSAAMPRGRS